MSKRVNRTSSVMPKQKKKVVAPKQGTQVFPRLGGESSGTVRAAIVSGRERPRIKGKELLQTITTPGTSPSQGDTAFLVLLGSSMQRPTGVASLYNITSSNLNVVGTDGPNTRVAGLMRYWSRYRARHFRLIYEPRCTVTTPGAISFRYFSDPNDYYQSASRAWQTISASSESRQGNVYEKISVPAKLDQKEDLYVDISEREDASVSNAELRQLFQGAFMGVYSAGIPANTALGDVYLEYDVELYGEELPDLPTVNLLAEEQVFLISQSSTTTTTAIPLDPYASELKDRTTELPSGELYPSWWDATTKRITELGTYLLDLSCNNPSASSGYSGANGNPQLNATATYSPTLSGPSVANGAYPPDFGANTESGKPYLLGVYKFVVSAVPYVLPFFLNFSTSQPTRRAGAIIVAIAKAFTTTGPLPTAAQVGDSPASVLVRSWLRNFANQLGEEETLRASANLWSCLGCSPDGYWHGVNFPDIEPILSSDLVSGNPTAHLYFSDDDAECIPSRMAARQIKPRTLSVAAKSAQVRGFISRLPRLTTGEEDEGPSVGPEKSQGGGAGAVHANTTQETNGSSICYSEQSAATPIEDVPHKTFLRAANEHQERVKMHTREFGQWQLIERP